MCLPAAVALFSWLRNVASSYLTKRCRVVALYLGCSSPIRTKAPGRVGPRRLWSSVLSSRPDCGDPDPLGPPLSVRPVLGAVLRSWLLGSGVVPVRRVSRRPRLHNERGACGALVHMESVLPSARDRAVHIRSCTSLFLWYRRGRQGGASCSRVSSPASSGILPLEPLCLES